MKSFNFSMDKTIKKFKKLNIFKKHDVLKHICAVAGQQKIQVYLVGGALRDLFLRQVERKKIIDWDFTLKSGALDFAKKLARRLNAYYVVLDKNHKTARVIYQEKDQGFRLDFTDFRAKTLKGDIKRRDFTINTLYADVAGLFQGNAEVIDCSGAIQDIKNRILKVSGKNSFKDDPLRILRGYAFCAQWGFRFDHFTEKTVKNDVFRLSNVSCERISEELSKIFGAKCSYKHIIKMNSLGILEIIFPETKALIGLDQGSFHHLDAWEHSLESLAQLEKLLRVLPRKIPVADADKVQIYLREEICSNRPRLWLLKLACLLHDIAKPQTKSLGDDQRVHFYTHEKQGSLIVKKIGKRLKLSRKEIAVLSDMVLFHLRAGQLVNRRPSKRARFRFTRDTGENALMILLLTIADRWAMRGVLSKGKNFVFYEEELFNMISEIFRQQGAISKRPRFLDGNEVMSLLGLARGPLVGKILAQLEEAQAIKVIHSKQQAECLARRIYTQMRQ